MNPAHKNFVLLVGCCLALTIPQSQTLGGNASKRRGYIPVLKIEEGYVDAQGVFIYYKSLGSGPPLLILHGGPGASHDYLLPHLAPLARKNRLVFIDERGGGKSPKLENPGEYTVGNMVEDTEAVRKALRLGKINLLGHSCGGVLAQAYALKYQKNQRVAIEALPLLLTQSPDMRLLLIGDGPDRRMLEELARGLGVFDKVVFLGIRNDIPELLTLLDVVISCSIHDFEGMSSNRIL